MTNRTFVAGLVVCAALMVAFGVVIAVLNAGNNRPEGVAEDWLTAVGDTVRKGVEDDARERAEKIGALSLARELVGPNPDREAAFPDLEVGKAVDVGDDVVKVGFRVHARTTDDEVEKTGVISLELQGDEWRVTEVAVDARPGVLPGVPELPSDGGPPPSSAPWSLWIGALVGAAIVGVITSALVRAAGRATDAVAATA